jgi:murein DD-endopeptidase MepM/ murein hydrolase activator NlpD
LILRKKKYHFNPVTLSYEEIKPDRKRQISEFLLYLSGFLAVIVICGYLLNVVIGSPEARILEKRLSMLNEKLVHLMDRGHDFSARLNREHFEQDVSYRTMLQVDTLPYNFWAAGQGGSAARDAMALSNDMEYRLDILITKLNKQLQLQTGSYEMLYEKALEHSSRHTHMPAIQPVASKDLVMISSDFGVRMDPFSNHAQVHSGLDFVAAVGKDVYATGDGTVTFVQFSRTGYGNEIVIDHAFGFGSRYAHLNKILVTAGQKVKRGQRIGEVGNSGRATGPHLHYEVIHENKPVNPAFYFDNSLTVEEYQQIVNKADNKTN